jgi:hypothetical protein
MTAASRPCLAMRYLAKLSSQGTIPNYHLTIFGNITIHNP